MKESKHIMGWRKFAENNLLLLLISSFLTYETYLPSKLKFPLRNKTSVIAGQVAEKRI